MSLRLVCVVLFLASFVSAAWLGEIKEPKQSENVYQISSPEELAWFAKQVNFGKNTINGKLTADLIFNTMVTDTVYEWVPIGDDTTSSYLGTFDGDNHTISGIFAQHEFAGIFGVIGGSGSVSNLRTKNSLIVSSYSYGGGIAGMNFGRISNCVVQSKLSVIETEVESILLQFYQGKALTTSEFGEFLNEAGMATLGGIAGYNVGSIENCTFEGSSSPNAYGMGGIVGEHKGGIIKNCVNKSNITVSGDVSKVIQDKRPSTEVMTNYAISLMAGGIAAFTYGRWVDGDFIAAQIENCVNKGNINAEANGAYPGRIAYAGGIVGYGASGSVRYSVNEGDVSAALSYNDTPRFYVGGVVALLRDTIQHCSNLGNVSARAQTLTSASVCSAYAGGLVGMNEGTVQHGFSAATEISSECEYGFAATIVGDGSSLTNVYYNSATSAKASKNSVGKTEAEMKTEKFKDNLNTANGKLDDMGVWKFDGGYPYPNEYGVDNDADQGLVASIAKVSDVKIQASANEIQIIGARTGEHFVVANAFGQILHEGFVQGSVCRIKVSGMGIRLIRVGNVSKKILVR